VDCPTETVSVPRRGFRFCKSKVALSVGYAAVVRSFSPPEGISVLQDLSFVAEDMDVALEFQSPGGDFGSARCPGNAVC